MRKGTSHGLLYKETNWPTLSERHSLNCLKQIWKISTNQCPDYLAFILPDKIGQARPNSKNEDNFVLSKCRKETYNNSFIPSTVCKWNNLPMKLRNIDNIMEKWRIKSNPLYYEGS